MKSFPDKYPRPMLLILLCIAVFTLIVSVSYTLVHKYNRYQPITNPNPQHFITLSGKIDPRLDATIVVTYQSTSEKCSKFDNWFKGANSLKYQYVNYPIYAEKNHYKLRLNLDNYLSGYCKWKLKGVYYSATYGLLATKKPLFRIDNKEIQPKKQYYINLFCRKKVSEGNNYLNCEPQMNFNSITNKIKHIKINFVFGSK